MSRGKPANAAARMSVGGGAAAFVPVVVGVAAGLDELRRDVDAAGWAEERICREYAKNGERQSTIDE